MQREPMTAIDMLKKAQAIHHDQIDMTVAVLASKSAQFITSGLTVSFNDHGIHANVIDMGFDSIETSILDDDSFLYEIKADVCIIIPDARDLPFMHKPPTSKHEVKTIVNDTIEKWQSLWSLLRHKHPRTHILHANYVSTPIRVFGQLETVIEYSMHACVSALNAELVKQSVHILDFDYLASCIGKDHWFDVEQYYLSGMPFRLECLPQVVHEITQKVLALVNSPKKVLVLDLDNTLWGGVIGEGVVDIDPSSPIGAAYRDFQTYILNLYHRGVLLAVASKNDRSIALAGFNSKHMVLQRDMISVFEANWDLKSENIKRIAQTLNLGLDSIVFVDDNPFECEQVKQFLPQVMTIPLGDNPSAYIQILDQALPFNWTAITDEDMHRNQSYQALLNLAHHVQDYHSYDAYLESLNMVLTWKVNDANTIQRFVQLTNKTNQFNVNTNRYAEEDIRMMIESNTHQCISFDLSDRFVNYGIISCVILKIECDTALIENWVMSCRVFSREVEFEVMNALKTIVQEFGCHRIIGTYTPTKRNHIVKDLYLNLGFIKEGSQFVQRIADIPWFQTKIGREHNDS